MVRETFGHVINGVEQQSVSGELFDDVNPWTEEVWAQIALGGKAEADAAVAAARLAFDEGPWPRMGFIKRGEILHRLADLMARDRRRAVGARRSGPSRARLGARLLVAVLCVCCDGTSITVLSLCSVSDTRTRSRAEFVRTRWSANRCARAPARSRHIYIFTNADSDCRFQVSAPPRGDVYIYILYIHKSRFRLQISGFRWAPDRRQTDREMD